MKKRYIIILVFLIFFAVFLNFGTFFSSIKEKQSVPVSGMNMLTLIPNIDMDLYSRQVTTYENFFSSDGLNPVYINNKTWTIKNLTFDQITYDFYTPNEISGKKFENRDGTMVYAILVQGPKTFWHNPENCYIFSNYTIITRSIEKLELKKRDSLYNPEIPIYINRLIVEKDGIRSTIGYTYIVRDKSDVNGVALLLLVNPDREDSSSLRTIATVINELFIAYPPREDTTQPGKDRVLNNSFVYGENNPPIIGNWLIIGPFFPHRLINDTYPPEDWDYHWLGENTSIIAPEEGEIIKDRTWKKINGSYGIINLGSFFQQKNPGFAYALEYIYSNVSREAVLHVVSDDGERVWLNGDQVLSRIRINYFEENINSFESVRGASLEDTVTVYLKQGWNVLLVEINQWKGSWEYYIQLRDLSGNIPLDLIYTTKRPDQLNKSSDLLFQIGYQDDSAFEFSSEWDTDSDYYIGEGFREFPRAVSKLHPETRIHWTMESTQEFEGYEMVIGIKKANLSDSGYTNADFFVNDHFAGTYSYPQDWILRKIPVNSSWIKNGPNIILIKYSKGGDYLVWDYIQLRGLYKPNLSYR